MNGDKGNDPAAPAWECEHPWHFGDPQFSPYRGWLQCPVCGVEAWDGTHDDD